MWPSCRVHHDEIFVAIPFVYCTSCITFGLSPNQPPRLYRRHAQSSFEQVLRAVHRFDLADRLADELADGMHDSAAGGAVCTPAQRRLILHLWATASELLATHASTSTTAHPAPVDDSSSDNALKECHVWLKVLAKFPATLLESCEVRE